MIRIVAGALALAVAGFAGYNFTASHHLFAPPLSPMHCPSPDTPTVEWIPDSQMAKTFGGSPPPNSVQWLGWTEVGMGCGTTLTITGGAR